MKTLFTIFAFIIATASISAQTEKVLSKSIDIEDSHTAYVMLPGDVAVNEWNENFVRITTTVTVQNMDETVVKRLVLVGRYDMEITTDKFGHLILIKMPNIANMVAVQGVELVESYSFEINAPKGFKVVVKDDLNPKAKQNNSTLGQNL